MITSIKIKASKKTQVITQITMASIFAVGAVFISINILDVKNIYGFVSMMIWMGLNIVPLVCAMVFNEQENNTVGVGFFIGVAIQWSLFGTIISKYLINTIIDKEDK